LGESILADIVIVDADMGNLKSVQNAFNRVGLNTEISREPGRVTDADAVVLPGVGAFEKAVHNLESFGLNPVLKAHVKSGKPLLGICLGMQLLADKSEEFGLHTGLGIIQGRIVKLSPVAKNARVPNIGWHEVNFRNRSENSIFSSELNSSFFYHIHSYHMVCETANDVAATINYGGLEVVVAVQRDNIIGVQFHPEKSQNSGLDLIERFGQIL
jgi:imidazole glycerol-phosphate synthase subunit HisH